MLTPEDIKSKEFTSTRLREGYAANEVDDFLDLIIINYTEKLRQIEHLESELRGARYKASDTPTAPIPAVEPELSLDSIKSILLSAQMTADRVKAQGEQKAAELRVEGMRKANELVVDAKTEAAQIINAANAEAERLEVSIKGMNQQREDCTASLRQTLEKLQAVLKTGDLAEGNS